MKAFWTSLIAVAALTGLLRAEAPTAVLSRGVFGRLVTQSIAVIDFVFGLERGKPKCTYIRRSSG